MLRNKNITTSMVDLLAFDVTENVSYIAMKHNKCTVNRTFEEPISMCVQCKVDERNVSCDTCPHR